MSQFYSNYLGPTLRKAMENANESLPKEFFDAREELTIARHSAGVLLDTREKLFGWYELNKDGAEKLEKKPGETDVEFQDRKAKFSEGVRIIANKIIGMDMELQKTMDRIVQVAERASNIYLKHSEHFDIHQIENVVSQITHIIFDVCGDEHSAIAEELNRRLRDDLKLPKSAFDIEQGSRIDPNKLLQDMVATLPGLSDKPPALLENKNESDVPKVEPPTGS